MTPKIVRRQSVTASSQYAKTVRTMVPITGTATRRGSARPLETAMALPTVTRMATPSAIRRKVEMSSSILGSSTMMEAPSSAPVRLLRPPMMMASRNRMVSSKL
ncbi:hypothetical protein D9M70_607050 [compost metagenome]